MNSISVTTALRLGGAARFDHIDPATLERARRRGIAVHAAAEALDLDPGAGVLDAVRAACAEGQYPFEVEVLDRVEAWLRFREAVGLDPVLVETNVHSNLYSFHGRIDRLGFVRGERRLVLIDLKPGEGYPKDRLQTAGYALAIQEELRLDYSPLRWTVHLGANGKPRKVSHDDARDATQDRPNFLAFLRVAHWLLANDETVAAEEKERAWRKRP